MTYTQLFNKQRAFTLIELLVVILIIGILIAIAAPSFLGQQDKAYDSSTKQTLTVVRKEAKAAYISNDAVHPALGPAITAGTILNQFKASEPQYSFVEYPVSIASTTNISVSRDSDSQITACKQSKSGVIFCLSADEAVGLEQIAFSGASLFGAETAYAAGKTDVAYSTGTGATALAAEEAARCLLDGAREVPEDPGCSPEGASAGWSEVSEGEAPSPVTPAPVNSVLPTIAGSAISGQTLTANAGVWTNATTFTYQWQSGTPGNFTDISGATNPTYTVTNEDSNKNLQVVVTAAGYTPVVRATSMITTPVTGPPINSVLPSVSGTAVVGESLTANNGTWNSATGDFSYQWYRDDALIASATSSTYTLVSADSGSKIKVRVGLSVSGGPTGYATSPQTDTVLTAPQNTEAPSISGARVTGNTLTGNNGTWTADSSITYSTNWRICDIGGTYCTTIADSANGPLVLTSGYAGASVRYVVTATANGVSTTVVSASSGAITLGAPVNSAVPTVSGSAVSGQTLTATAGTWSNSPTYAYQWQQCTTTSDCANISGATSSSFTLTATEVGKKVRVVVTATTDGGSPTAASALTDTVAAPSAVDVVTSDNPAAFYSFNNTLASSPATGPTLVANGNASFFNITASNQGGRIQSGGFYSTPTNVFANQSAFTWESWLRNDGSGTWARAFDSGVQANYMMLSVNAGNNNEICNGTPFCFAMTGVVNGAYRYSGVTSNTNIPNGTWYHIAVTQTPSGTITMYINGAQVAQQIGTANTVHPSHVPLGNGQNYLGRSVYNDNPYNGAYNNVALYTNALSASQIAAHYAAGQ